VDSAKTGLCAPKDAAPGKNRALLIPRAWWICREQLRRLARCFYINRESIVSSIRGHFLFCCASFAGLFRRTLQEARQLWCWIRRFRRKSGEKRGALRSALQQI
jgi:hypothetical protein